MPGLSLNSVNASNLAALSPVRTPALFERYPALASSLPWVSLTCGPTPVERLARLGKAIGCDELFVKRDDLCGQWYGGNKPRKLEFLLAEALSRKASSVMTLGALGSHHTLATAVYCHQLGMKSVLGLANRPVGEREAPNLLASHRLGARLFYMHKDYHLLWRLPLEWLRAALSDRKPPFFIPPGGSSPLGCMGYVSAAFELAGQIERGEAKAPDEIWLPAGSLGTMAGLVLGLQLAGIDCRVVGVKIYPAGRISTRGVLKLVKQCHGWLKRRVRALPDLSMDENAIEVIEDQLGAGYACTTPEAEAAIALAEKTESIRLEHVYTGKCLAALIAAGRNGLLQQKRILFWNTYNSLPYEARLPEDDGRKVPEFFYEVKGG